MRLICPNCSAQYEIDASLIPDEGRDVQCSNCGHTWFELPPVPPAFGDAPEPEAVAEEAAPEQEPAYESDSVAGVTAEAEREPERAQEPETPPEPAPQAEAVAEPEPEPETPEPEPEHADEEVPEERTSPPGDTDVDQPETHEVSAAARAIAAASESVEEDTGTEDPFAAAAAAGAALQRRRPVDDEALGILREEADRELAKRRAAPSAPLETQTDMPLDEVRGRATPSRALRARMARSDSEAEKVGTTPDKAAKPKDARARSSDDGYEAPRRDLLPDIDEINSSLKSRKARAEATPEAAAVERRGFRSGFLLMVALAALMIFAYAWAPSIASAVPSLEGPLLVYVDWANGVRDWIDAVLGV